MKQSWEYHLTPGKADDSGTNKMASINQFLAINSPKFSYIPLGAFIFCIYRNISSSNALQNVSGIRLGNGN
ncbi:hypothetical protein [Allocoleopsis sp.]|uniref:hypothetical protein n=1 Tax=Allocoleopsis sp. TaxID=3088169 RepID=UPI002FD0ACA7